MSGVVVELVGGPNDGQTWTLRPDEVTGRLVFAELRRDVAAHQRALHDRLLAGERVLATELEHPEYIDHVYSRTDRRSDTGALVYRYVPPR